MTQNKPPALKIPWYKTVIAFRSAAVILCVSLLQALEPIGTSPVIVSVAGILGVIGASKLAHTRLKPVGFILLLAALWLTSSASFGVLNFLFSGITPRYFSIETLKLHTQTGLMAAFLTGYATWLFWRVRGAITFEAIVISGIAIITFAGHRNYHFDRPKIINSLAWQLGVSHLTMLIIVGSGLLALALCYLYLASLAVRPKAEPFRIHFSQSPRQVFLSILALLVAGGILYGVQTALYNFFNSAMLARVANGVGMGENPGVSPLSFQSALGSTNQPAGLIRLEGDYADNPFSPMLYLRESALSQFNGKEMVFAGRAFDSDLPGVSPRDVFTGKEDVELSPRTPLIQSIYPLADHDSAFAVDYPISIVQLKNPNPTRFKSSYRAYSIAPAFKLSDINEYKVGDPRWSEDVKTHYLDQHPDKRYKDLALEITKDASLPVQKVLAITNYLSRTAIYTLTPNHTVAQNEDPVAPFLFGDHRGYCVHFAHAIVYMLRSLGIPARIGTGYLTDLSQAKDGHILLRMSDRHAWAEAYLSGLGWVPFDVQPDQVESHADTQVDTKLLEELMGTLEPGEEILPPESTKNEPGMDDPETPWVPSQQTLGRSVVVLLVLFALIKGVLRHGWRIAPSPRSRARWGYISIASRLHDQGISREFGETRAQFAQRVPHGALTGISSIINLHAYAPAPSVSIEQVTQEIRAAHTLLNSGSVWRRIFVTLNPASTTNLLGGGTW